jgi:N,N'-diacetyllegionaminate synthase
LPVKIKCSHILVEKQSESLAIVERIKKGEKFTSTNLTIKRPGNGISPMKLFKVIGKIAKKSFSEDELIKL